MSKSKAAVELAQARWRKATPEQRKAIGAAMTEGRRKRISAERRREIAQKAVRARWAKYREERVKS